MNLTGLLDALAPDPAVTAVLERAGSPELDLSAPPGMRPFLIAALAARADRPVLAVTATSREAEDLVDALQSLLPADAVVDYPGLGDAAARAAVAARGHRRPAAGRAAPAAPPASRRRRQRSGQRRRRAGAQRAAAAGPGSRRPRAGRAAGRRRGRTSTTSYAGWPAIAYSRVDMVERRGEFAVRGGILDVFPPTEEHPLRVEFWGDTVEEVRWFKVADQRSLEIAEHGLWAPPCREILLTDEVRATARELAEAHPSAGRDARPDRRGRRGRGDGVARAGSRRAHDAAARRAACGHARAVVRPGAHPHPSGRSRAHERGVPGRVLGGGRRWWQGADRPRAQPACAPSPRCRSHALELGVPWWSVSPFVADEELDDDSVRVVGARRGRLSR